jgi:hypothetical protein
MNTIDQGEAMRTAHRGLSRFIALAVIVTLPVLGLAGVASAAKVKASHCHKHHSCQAGGGASGGATGSGATPSITLQIDPNPVVEVGPSVIEAVVQVESLPSLAGDYVTISSSQLVSSCEGGVFFGTDQTTNGENVTTLDDEATVALDDDGNATVALDAVDCAPGSSVIEASLDVAPYYTALETLVASPPVVTPSGVFGYPNSSGIVGGGETETGDSVTSGDSDVYAVFDVETSPVYAEQNVEINSDQLQSRCGTGWTWVAPTFNVTSGNKYGAIVEGPLDDDGNAAFFFIGSSCAAGTSEVIADVEAGTHPTYTTTFTVNPPAPTI